MDYEAKYAIPYAWKGRQNVDVRSYLAPRHIPGKRGKSRTGCPSCPYLSPPPSVQPPRWSWSPCCPLPFPWSPPFVFRPCQKWLRKLLPHLVCIEIVATRSPMEKSQRAVINPWQFEQLLYMIPSCYDTCISFLIPNHKKYIVKSPFLYFIIKSPVYYSSLPKALGRLGLKNT